MFKFLYNSLLLSVIAVQIATDHASADPAADVKKTDQASVETKTGGIVTLYAIDSNASTFDFGKGLYGRRAIQDGSLYSDDPDIDFGNRNQDALTIAFKGGRLGKIIDVGTSEELRKSYGYRNVVGGLGFASIRRKGTEILIANSNYQADFRKEQVDEKMFQPLTETKELFEKGIRTASADVKLAHIYILHITDKLDGKFERAVKLLVIEFRPGESVTLRWQRLE